MTVAKWLHGFDTHEMVNQLHQTFPGGLSRRKSWLAAATVCRRVWNLLDPDSDHTTIEVIEHFCEGAATYDELEVARSAAIVRAEAARRRYAALPHDTDAWRSAYADAIPKVAVAQTANAPFCEWSSGQPSSASLNEVMWAALRCESVVVWKATGVEVSVEDRNARWRVVRRENAALLREIFGNPFHRPLIEPHHLTSTVVALAQAIYAERAFDRLPVLADAIEEAGCDDPTVLAHLRGDGPHVRGCWVLDMLLGKT